MEQNPASFHERKKILITRTFWLILAIFLVNVAAMKFYWYSTIWWFDIPMHFFGGFWLGLWVLWLYAYAWHPAKPVRMYGALTAVVVGVLVLGGAWEIFELGIDNFITIKPHNITDTVSDLFFDLAGGLSAFLYCVRRGFIEEGITNNDMTAYAGK